MDEAKRKQLEAAGFRVGSAAEFLCLTPDEERIVALKLALSAALKRRRADRSLSQTALARRLGSSQSRVAKMEAGDPGVSIDLLIRALLATGATLEELGDVVARRAA